MWVPRVLGSLYWEMVSAWHYPSPLSSGSAQHHSLWPLFTMHLNCWDFQTSPAHRALLPHCTRKPGQAPVSAHLPLVCRLHLRQVVMVWKMTVSILGKLENYSVSVFLKSNHPRKRLQQQQQQQHVFSSFLCEVLNWTLVSPSPGHSGIGLPAPGKQRMAQHLTLLILMPFEEGPESAIGTHWVNRGTRAAAESRNR